MKNEVNKRRVTIRIAPFYKRALEHYAIDSDSTITDIIVRLITEQVQNKTVYSDKERVVPQGETMSEFLAFNVDMKLYKEFRHYCVDIRARPERLLNQMIYFMLKESGSND